MNVTAWKRQGRGQLCYLENMYFNNNEPILTSKLAAGIVQDIFAGEAGEGEGGEEEMTGGYFYRYFYCSGWKFFRFLAMEFLSQNTNTRMHIRNVHTYIYISKI